ncbi:YdcF family protein [Gordonia phthalatica]|uniref:YdcF family protein n=1 Tax=Gordonia phthalatica TaxID=1136941 RepID=UPI0007821153|nr:YdcF family protein [Gordonia phthalatica]
MTGGNSWWLPIPESAFMHLQLANRGVTPFKVIEEPTAMSTVQNAQRTVAMLKGLGASGAVIVTNGFHMKQALTDFRKEAQRQGTRLDFVPGYA